MRKPRLVLAIAGLLAIAACGHSPPTRFFTLTPSAPAAPGAAAPGSALRVDHVTIPPVLDRPELVREYAANQLKVDDFSHWGAPLGELMRAALVEDLTARLPAGRVIPLSTPKVEGTADLVVEIAGVHEGAGRLVADVDWILTRRPPAPPHEGGPLAASPPAVVRTLRHERIEAPLSGSSQQTYAAALSQVVGTLADRIVADLGS